MTALQLLTFASIIICDMKELIGEHFVNLQDLSFDQAEEVLRIQQKDRSRKFGEIAVELGYLEPRKLENFLEEEIRDGAGTGRK